MSDIKPRGLTTTPIARSLCSQLFSFSPFFFHIFLRPAWCPFVLLQLFFSSVHFHPIEQSTAMLFPTALILAVLSITPALAAPVLNIDSDASLIARDEPQQGILEARGETYGIDLDMMEKRDLADEESFVELVTRSPEPEPEPLPEPFPLPIEGELEDVERRGWFGAALKIGKGIAKLAHKGHQAHQSYKNRHHKRSKIGRKIGNFFKKAVKGVAKVASWVMKRNDQGAVSAAPLVARSVEEPIELEARDIDEVVELEARDVEEPMELEARDIEESIELEARDFDEVEIEARDVEEPMELEARDVEEIVELEARDFEESVDLEARDFEEEEF
ncbi:hypothetical protein CPB86DRAFT_872106 [Serendipita vermifera]|nr:hypothetical protein CPB86DRAFT_872106 [Serendipita vermifera]